MSMQSNTEQQKPPSCRGEDIYNNSMGTSSSKFTSNTKGALNKKTSSEKACSNKRNIPFQSKSVSNGNPTLDGNSIPSVTDSNGKPIAPPPHPFVPPKPVPIDYNNLRVSTSDNSTPSKGNQCGNNGSPNDQLSIDELMKAINSLFDLQTALRKTEPSLENLKLYLGYLERMNDFPKMKADFFKLVGNFDGKESLDKTIKVISANHGQFKKPWAGIVDPTHSTNVEPVNKGKQSKPKPSKAPIKKVNGDSSENAVVSLVNNSDSSENAVVSLVNNGDSSENAVVSLVNNGDSSENVGA